jgi:hypothetical protein
MSRAALVRSELGEGMGHFRQAAGYAADGMGQTAGPAWRVARRTMPFAGPLGGASRFITMRRMAMRRMGMRRMGMRGMGMRGMGAGPVGAMRRMGISRSVGAARRWGTRVAAMAPLAAVAPTGGAMRNRRANRAMTKVIMKRDSKAGRRRLGMLVGLLAAGAAAGAASAMAARRRNRMAWEEYETHGHGYPTDRTAPLAEPAYDPMGTP